MSKQKIKIEWRLNDQLKLAGIILLMVAMTILLLFGKVIFGSHQKTEKQKTESAQLVKLSEEVLEGMDFSIPLTSITNPTLGFSSFAGKKLLIFYFNPTCSHCQEAIPQIQSLADEIRGQEYEAIAIAIQRSTQVEIQEFITKYQCRLPVFWDGERKFGGTYNATALPTIFLVRSGGGYFRMDGFSEKTSLDQLRQSL